MAEGKKSFIVYSDWKKYVDELNDEQIGQWTRWMFDYCNDRWENKEIEYPNDVSVRMLCMMTKDTLKRDLKKYEERKERMKTARNLNPNNNKELLSNSNQTEIKQISINNQSNISSVNVNVNDNVNVNVLDKSNNNINRSSKLDRYADLRKQILDYLNDSIGSHYRDCKANKRLIDSRLDDGYTLEDFKHVIDVKAYQWKDSDLQKYLRPETLFCASHFESYLNEEKQTGVKNNPFDLPDAGFRSL